MHLCKKFYSKNLKNGCSRAKKLFFGILKFTFWCSLKKHWLFASADKCYRGVSILPRCSNLRHWRVHNQLQTFWLVVRSGGCLRETFNYRNDLSQVLIPQPVCMLSFSEIFQTYVVICNCTKSDFTWFPPAT